jgi:hypothetical protein
MFKMKNDLEKSALLARLSQIKVGELNSGVFFKGRRFNYSDKVIFLEADILFNPGAEFSIAIEDSPFSRLTTGHEFYNAVIKHCSELGDSHFRYGSGARIVESFGSAIFCQK